MADNPDVAELIAYNKAACEHANKSKHTRWMGGRAGRIGGQHPETWWYCNDCKEWVRPYCHWTDSPEGQETIAKIKAAPPWPAKGEP